jgi:hypothetical protein
MDCEFCKKTFSSKPNLVAHQKNAKYCLELQGKSNDHFKCNYCEKVFTCQQRLTEHKMSVCKMKDKANYETEISKIKDEFSVYKNQEKNRIQEKDSYYQEKEAYYQEKLKDKDEKLREKNEYIAKLEAKLEKFENAVVTNMAATTHVLEAKAVKASSTTTNNTTLNTNITVNNVLNLSEEHVKKVLSERINYNVVYAGQAGLATFVFDNILKDATGKLIYRCVDASRQMFEFIDENGETVRDMKAEKLTQSLLKGDVIRLGLEAAAVGWNTEDEKLNNERVGVFGAKVNEYADLNRNNTVFRSKVSSLTT